jgi:antitoxin component YwqK of YwqJK toxin-antitoxin module
MKISNNLLSLIVLFSVFSLNAFSQISFDSIVKNSDDVVVLSKNNIVFTGKIRGTCRMWDKTCEFGQAEIFMSRLNTILVEGYYVKGKEEGLWKYKTVDGKLRGKMNFISGLPHGKYVIYYLNGKKCEKGKYKNGILDGVYRCWEENGKPSVKQIFKNGKEIKAKKYPFSSPIISY